MSLVLATAGYDHTIRFWEAITGVCWRTIPHNESHVNKLDISQDKKLLAAAGNPAVRVYDIQSNGTAPYCTFQGHTSNVSAVGFNKESRWLYSVSGSEDKTVRIWDIRSRNSHRTFESRAPVTCVALVQGQNELISGDQDGNIRVWDITGSRCSCELVPEVDVAVRSISVATDGSQVVAANNSGICFVWSMLRGGGDKQSTNFEPLKKLEAHESYILKTLVSPDVRKLATTSADHTVKIWSMYDYSCERVLRGHRKWVWDAVFSIDDAYLVTVSSDTTARLWNVAEGTNIMTYTGHNKAVVCCALNDNAIEVG